MVSARAASPEDTAHSIVIVDAQPLLLAGMAALIGACPGLRLAGQGAAGAEALGLFDAVRPDLMLIGLTPGPGPGAGPGAAGSGAIDAIVRIRAAHPHARLVVLGERDDGDDVAQALAAGAAAALRRDARFEQIIACIEAVLCGRHVPLPPGLQAAQPAQAARLSPRELDILRHLSAGNSNKVIARHAGIGVGTVKYHVNNILSKLNVSCRTQAASVAIRRGLVHFTQ